MYFREQHENVDSLDNRRTDILTMVSTMYEKEPVFSMPLMLVQGTESYGD
jgi:hypothetical protein